MDDIVNDGVLPDLDLAVDGLTTRRDRKSGDFDLGHEEVTVDQEPVAAPVPAGAVAEPNPLEVYGWESSLWKKIRGYIGF